MRNKMFSVVEKGTDISGFNLAVNSVVFHCILLLWTKVVHWQVDWQSCLQSHATSLARKWWSAALNPERSACVLWVVMLHIRENKSQGDYSCLQRVMILNTSKTAVALRVRIKSNISVSTPQWCTRVLWCANPDRVALSQIMCWRLTLAAAIYEYLHRVKNLTSHLVPKNVLLSTKYVHAKTCPIARSMLASKQIPKIASMLTLPNHYRPNNSRRRLCDNST